MDYKCVLLFFICTFFRKRGEAFIDEKTPIFSHCVFFSMVLKTVDIYELTCPVQ